jgi:hypothetical protein
LAQNRSAIRFVTHVPAHSAAIRLPHAHVCCCFESRSPEIDKSIFCASMPSAGLRLRLRGIIR